MVTQYPHIMTIITQDSSVQDADGNWQPGTSDSREVICRAEPNGSGKFLIVADGTQIVYAWTVYMPVQIEFIFPGAEITVMKGTEIVATGKVIRFSSGQLNARLWL